MDDELHMLIEGYAELIIKRGVSLEKGQTLVINCNVEGLDFARILTRHAYENGAGDVHVIIEDEVVTQMRYQNAALYRLEQFNPGAALTRLHFMDDGACFIRINTSDPDLLLGVDEERISTVSNARSKAMAECSKRTMNFDVKVHACCVPSVKWAGKVFPELNEADAFDKMWRMILKACYSDCDDPVAAWDEHINSIKDKIKVLNSLELKRIKFKSLNGTDLEMDLADDNTWFGGVCITKSGTEFSPSIPTDEVFTAPHCRKINGIVKNSIPLYHGGCLIDDFSLIFENGRVVDFEAKTGYSVLKSILNTDEGARSLGEVSLVPFTSRIAQSGLIFYETQFDENASCHLALGAGYPGCILGEDRSYETLIQKGLNMSSVHIDFMFGAKNIIITGIKENGDSVEIIP